MDWIWTAELRHSNGGRVGWSGLLHAKASRVTPEILRLRDVGRRLQPTIARVVVIKNRIPAILQFMSLYLFNTRGFLALHRQIRLEEWTATRLLRHCERYDRSAA